MKIAINKNYSGFKLSDKGMETFLAFKDTEYFKIDGTFCTEYYYVSNKERIYLHNIFDSEIAFRSDEDIIKVVEMGKEYWGETSELKIVEVPDGVSVQIGEYDGNEWVEETHRKWY